MYKHLRLVYIRNRNGLIQYPTRKTSNEVQSIVIPKEIQRGPTDILKALASTVEVDTTAAHYKYHDDPYLTPYSNPTKRNYALSQEAGRKAAQWIREQHADLFQHRVADPVIEAYIPKPVYDEESNVNEEILKNSIMNICVKDSITIFNLLKQKGIEIKPETKQSLLELVCYYNGEESLNEDWIEERWYRQSKKSKERWKNTWNEDGFAEQLFKELGTNDSKSVCTLLCGMCRFGQLDKAWKLYEHAKTNRLKLNTTTYNSLLAKTCFLKEDHALVVQSLQSLLTEMIKDNVKPNLGTLNSIMEALSNISSNSLARSYGLSMLTEFKAIGIEPCLATFYHLINLQQYDKELLRGLFPSILDYLGNTTLEIRDIKDILFFSRAMELIYHKLKSNQLAYRLNTLLHKDNNYNFIGDSFKESLYYRYYFLLLCKTEPLNTFMEIYDNLVPNIYTPEPAVMSALLTAVEENAEFALLPRIWSDIVLYEQADRNMIFERVLSIASKNKETTLSEAMAKLGWSMWEMIENTPEERRNYCWTGPLLGDLMSILLAADELSKAHLVMDKMEQLQNEITGEPKVASLLNYLDSCIQVNSLDAAIKCIRYSQHMGFIETDEMARKLYNSEQLTDSQTERLISIVGENILKLSNKKSSKVQE